MFIEIDLADEWVEKLKDLYIKFGDPLIDDDDVANVITNAAIDGIEEMLK